ncbi:hypothetical protein [Streptomyces purpureus]|uniref:Uncharacterized protein n=1 Tax=Streptomyces purpureus TaxID=1951 RepID=A0A918HEQ9_9ACTN|nr:hypothetical protein [Streptomyces purpureus]GGT52695.1 hypothetical protein GCM10014713_53250 [Streptomyces purpureus]
MSYYGHHHSPARPAGKPFFALMKAWGAGLVVLMLTSYLQIAHFYETFATPERLESFGGVLWLVHLPNAVCIALSVWVAARVHPEPYRDSPVRHMSAAFAVPVAAQLVSYTIAAGLPWRDLGALSVAMSLAVLVVGCVAGYFGDRLRADG